MSYFSVLTLPMSVAPANIGGAGWKDVDGRLTSSRSAPLRAFVMPSASVKSAAAVSTFLPSTEVGFGFLETATTSCPAREAAATCVAPCTPVAPKTTTLIFLIFGSCYTYEVLRLFEQSECTSRDHQLVRSDRGIWYETRSNHFARSLSFCLVTKSIYSILPLSLAKISTRCTIRMKVAV